MFYSPNNDTGTLGSKTVSGTGNETNTKNMFVIDQQYKYKYKTFYGSKSLKN